MGTDCVFDVLPGSTQQQGAPYMGFIDSSTGKCSSIPGVTEAVSDFVGLHGTYVTTDPKGHKAVGFGILNFSYWFVALNMPVGGQNGSVKPVVNMDAAPAWIAPLDPTTLITWQYEEEHSTGASAVTVVETLNRLDPLTGKTAMVWTNTTEVTTDSPPPAFFGADYALNAGGGILFTQSQNQSIGKFDLQAGKALPRLQLTDGEKFMCLHYDQSTNTLGALVASTAEDTVNLVAPSALNLVSINTKTGKLTTRLQLPPSFPAYPFFHLDAKPSLFPPVCSFSESTGQLAFLHVDADPGALPAFANRAMYVSTMDTRRPSAPSVPTKVLFPFESSAPIGNRTWRAISPSISFVND
jgi:hypothetical protein